MKRPSSLSWLLSSLLLLSGCGSAAPSPSAVPSGATPTATAEPTASPAPSATAAATATPFAAGVPAFPGAAFPAGPPEPPGTYRTSSTFSVPFILTTNAAYRGSIQKEPSGEIFGIGQGDGDDPPQAVYFFAAATGFTVAQVVSDIRSTTNMTTTEPQQVQLFGQPATQLDATSSGSGQFPSFNSLLGYTGSDTWTTATDGAHVRIAVTTVSGRTLMVYIESPAAEFDAFAVQIDPILKSVTFPASQ